jgi:hypothetical protein
MTTIYETTDRLIGEQLDALLTIAWQLDHRQHAIPADSDEFSHRPTMPIVRLVGAARLLYQQHCVDAKGRCRICARRVRWWPSWIRPCTVYAALNFYLTQPDELVLRELPRPPTALPRPSISDTEQTIEFLRIRNRPTWSAGDD